MSSPDALLPQLYPAAPPPALAGLRAGPGDAVLAWVHYVADPLERGVSHVLSNRAAGLDATLEVLREETDPERRSAGFDDLRAEVGRLFDLNATFRLLPADTSAEEAFDLEEIAQDAAQALACHMAFRMARHAVQVSGSAPPVRSVRWALFRATVALVDGLRRLGGGATIRLGLGGDPQRATLTVAADHPPSTLSLDEGGVPYACYMLAALGGSVRMEGTAFVLELPSLAERRARDAAGKGAAGEAAAAAATPLTPPR